MKLACTWAWRWFLYFTVVPNFFINILFGGEGLCLITKTKNIMDIGLGGTALRSFFKPLF